MHLACIAAGMLVAAFAYGLGHFLGYRAANLEVYDRLKKIATEGGGRFDAQLCRGARLDLRISDEGETQP